MKHKLQPLIDADGLVYRVGFASDSNNDKQGEELSHCLHGLKETLSHIYGLFDGPRPARVFLQGPGNYRERVATLQPYKGNRDPSAKPRWYEEIRHYLVEYHGAELISGMEVDDMCSIIQWEHKDRSTCIVSSDKDLRNTPGYHYNWVKKELDYVPLAQANYNFWKQVLTGDSVDNIRGLPKVGPKTADKILAGKTSWVDLHNAVLQAYESRGLSREEFRENATLVWMQREEWVNFDGSRLDGEQEEGISSEGEEQNSSLSCLPGVVGG